MKKNLTFMIFSFVLISNITFAEESSQIRVCNTAQEKQECLKNKWSENFKVQKSDAIILFGKGEKIFPIIDNSINQIREDARKLQVLEERILVKNKILVEERGSGISYIKSILQYMQAKINFYQEIALLESALNENKRLLENDEKSFNILLEYSSLDELEPLFKDLYTHEDSYKQGLEKFLYTQALYKIDEEASIPPSSLEEMAQSDKIEFYKKMIEKEYLLQNRDSISTEYFANTIQYLDEEELEGFFYSLFSTKDEAHIAIEKYLGELGFKGEEMLAQAQSFPSIMDIINSVNKDEKEHIIYMVIAYKMLER